jgi:hypothetical protein
VVARTTLFVSAAAVTPLVVPWSVVVEPVVPPMVTVVVLPAAPPVAMATALFVAVMVAPVARLSVDAAVVPPIEVVEAPSTGPMIVVVVEPTTPPVPMFTALVEPEIVAPEATLIVPAAVELPKVRLALENVFAPPMVCVPAESTYCWVVPFWRMNRPEVVVQMSPLTGVVGATPCGRFRPAVVVVGATVVTKPVKVLPARGA